jgi:TRAP-type C4-dicarboxylate transport system permease large subunit
MLTGVIMSSGGLAERLVACAQTLVGWMRGGLAQIAIVVSAIFADISGSAVGDAASVGRVLIPQMIRRGYPAWFAAAVVPGLILAAGFMVVNLLLARRLDLAPAASFVVLEVPKAFASAVLPLFTIVIIIGGILGGVFTPTESGVVAIAYSLCVALWRRARCIGAPCPIC